MSAATTLDRPLSLASENTSAEPRRNDVMRRVFRTGTGAWGAAVLAIVVGSALTAPLIAPAGPNAQRLADRLKPPAWIQGGSLAHLIGTDALGRDSLVRVIWAGRTSLAIAGVSVALALLVGVLLGLLSGYYGGKLDTVLMRIVDVQLSFPYILLAIAVMAFLKPSLLNLVIVLALRSWVVYARTVRGSVLSLKTREFVEAAVATGARKAGIIFRHIAPNVLAPVLVISSFQFAELVISEASLSFLGLGVQPPTPSWGAMLSDGREYLTTAWWLGLFPGIALVITVLGINLFGDALRDALDPRLQV
ncbi:MAG TPA: ABC transporter permease [Chloroflexota bacterium]